MAIDPSEARLRFLRQAAYQLAITSPTVSAEISSTYVASVFDNEDTLQQAKKEWDTLRREVCGACGNIMLPGWSCLVTHQSPAAAKRKGHSKSPASSKKMVYTCQRCDRKSVQSLPPRPPQHATLDPMRRRSQATEPANTEKPVGESQDKVTKSANATSKQRKKSRKGGLQAMLEKNKSQSSAQGGLGLDLMDFMR